jgi:periplasmic protein CpxP/Spy
MKFFVVVGLAAGVAAALPALAQNAPSGATPQVSRSPPALATPTSPTPMTSTQPPSTQPPSTLPPTSSTIAGTGAVPGANSFTEAQARRRLEQNGYSQVSSLSKGKDGIWRGTATKNGASSQVSVDYKGDISMN